MATDSFWAKRREQLLESYRFPLNPNNVHAGGYSMATVEQVLECLVVGMTQNAKAVLDSLIPQMEEDLRTKEWIRTKGPFEGTEILSMIARSVHLAHWLKHDQIDASLVDAAISWRHALEESREGPRLTQASILDSMLLEIEAKQPERAAKVYEVNEKTLLTLPPQNMRFTSNARSVLYFHLRNAKDKATADLRSKALTSFLNNATQWDRKVDPLPYVLPTHVARVARACWWLNGEDSSLARVVEAVH